MAGKELAEKLGYAGLLPFAFFALEPLVIGALERPLATEALLTYAAVILSFLGGVVWGRAVAGSGFEQRPFAFVVAVLPSLIGWVAVLAGGQAGLLLCAAGFAAMLWYDLRDNLPGWFAALRVQLSMGAILSCLVGLLAGQGFRNAPARPIFRGGGGWTIRQEEVSRSP